jgi:FtsZ-interacting cell division protein ZipA
MLSLREILVIILLIFIIYHIFVGCAKEKFSASHGFFDPQSEQNTNFEMQSYIVPRVKL